VPGDFITLKEVLASMDRGEEFSLVFITADQKKNTGGELVEVKKAYKHNWLSPAERKKQQGLQPESQIIKRDPRHYDNSTRNIRLAANGDIRKVHIRLIRKFNGSIVL
jgi:hypothetical protein